MIVQSTGQPYQIGALYSRKNQIHGLIGGQRQGGISTPKGQPFVVLFTGEAGAAHGYRDYWDNDGLFHYFGEGQSGDMAYRGGNLAILHHIPNGKRLLVFQMMGHSKPYRYLGEFKLVDHRKEPNISDTSGALRTALVFVLKPLNEEFGPFDEHVKQPGPFELLIGATAATRLSEVRTKQSLFRRRLLTVEKECRLTGIRDLRFLRASHIKPWSKCATGSERIDGHNGLLLTSSADLLFDQGWITFQADGKLVTSDLLPVEVIGNLGINLSHGRPCGSFDEEQRAYLGYHRKDVFEKFHSVTREPLDELFAALHSSPP